MAIHITPESIALNAGGTNAKKTKHRAKKKRGPKRAGTMMIYKDELAEESTTDPARDTAGLVPLVTIISPSVDNAEMGTMHRVRSHKSDENMLAVDFLAFASVSIDLVHAPYVLYGLHI